MRLCSYILAIEVHQDEPQATRQLLAIHWHAVRVEADCSVPSTDGFKVLQLLKFDWVSTARLLHPILKGRCTVVDRNAGAEFDPFPLLLFIVC